MISAGLPHGAIPLTGAMCLAVAAKIPGTLVNALVPARSDGGSISIAHASGVIDVEALVATKDGEVQAREVVVYRTARRLMEGRVLLPL
jgi:2-methylaconitate isomerase